MTETYSFDVFDTCLTRKCIVPSDIFLEIAQGWGDVLEPIMGADFIEVFREARVEAERVALKRSATEETTLLSIWQEMALMFPSIGVMEGFRRELLAESNSLVRVAKTHALVMDARSAGKRIAFISDTYLPFDFIREQLEIKDFFREGDFLFVSSEIGKTKRKKSLYLHALKELALTPAKLFHHGDHPISDVAIPQGLGIRATLLPMAELNNTEKKLAKSLSVTSDAWAGRLLGEMRSFRVSHTGSYLVESIASLTAGLIGPILAAIALWVLRRAERDGVDRLYFFSRDGFALYRVASELSSTLGLAIECRYLQVSRQALLLPSTSLISPEGMPWLRRHFEVARVRLLAGKLDIPEELLVKELDVLVGKEGGDFVIKNDEQWTFFWDKLSSGDLKSFLLQRINERRKSLLGYLHQEGLFDSVVVGCVDLGWFQSCQAALVELCRSVLPDFQIRGYYLSLAHGRAPYLKHGTGQAMFHQAPRDRQNLRQGHPALHNATLLEHLLSCAPHGTVRDYVTIQQTINETTVVRYVPSCGTTYEKEQSLKGELVDYALLFTKQCNWMDTWPTDRLKKLVNALLEAAISSPDPCWFEVLESFTFSTDQGGRKDKSLVRRPSVRDAICCLVIGKEFFDLRGEKIGIWPQLSWLAMSRMTRFLFKVSRRVHKAGYFRDCP